MDNDLIGRCRVAKEVIFEKEGPVGLAPDRTLRHQLGPSQATRKIQHHHRWDEPAGYEGNPFYGKLSLRIPTPGRWPL